MKLIAKINRRSSIDYTKLETSLKQNFQHSKLENEQMGLVKFFQNRNLRGKACAYTFMVIFGNQIYYAIPFTIESFGTNFYLSFAAQSFMDIPAALCFKVIFSC